MSDPRGEPWLPAAGWLAALVMVLAVALSLFGLYAAGFGPLDPFFQRGIHMALVLMLCFALFGPVRGQPRGWLATAIDTLLFLGAASAAAYLLVNLDAIFERAGFWTRTDIVFGVIATVTLLEGCRRVVGPSLTVIAVLAIIYALAGPRGELPWLGQWLPEALAHRGYSLERVVAMLYLGQEGIYGLPLGVAASFVFMFVLFGAFLQVTGAGRFFIDLAFALTGRQRGGPAKAAVLASAGMGSISGSAIANVAATGSLTIPLMKRLGYRPAQAGGIEAAASTGGQILPPLMGAGAFLIAEYTRLPYIEIVKASIFPALLYLGSVYLLVHLVALRQGMGRAESGAPGLAGTLAAGGIYLLPLAVLITLLVQGLSPMRVAFWALVSLIILSCLRGLWQMIGKSGAQARTSLRQGAATGLNGLVTGARNALSVTVACATAGIIVAVVGLTGLGLKISGMIVGLAGSSLLLALVLIMLASLILGLGLPVTASYIVLIVLVGPALAVEFGLPLLIAHLIVFWYSQDSNVTPPVALAGFTAAAIAGSRPMATSLQAWKFAKGLYLIPLYMAFHPEIIIGGDPGMVLFKGLAIALALAAFATGIEGWGRGRLPAWQRVWLLSASALAFAPDWRLQAAACSAIVIGLLWPGISASSAGTDR